MRLEDNDLLPMGFDDSVVFPRGKRPADRFQSGSIHLGQILATQTNVQPDTAVFVGDADLFDQPQQRSGDTLLYPFGAQFAYPVLGFVQALR